VLYVNDTQCSGHINVDGASTTRRQLTRPPPGTVDFDPTFSPDGSRVVFRTTRPDPFPDPDGLGLDGIAIVDVASSHIHEIQPPSGGLFPAWSPGGDLIAFTSVGRSGGESIFVMRPNSSGLRDLQADGEFADWS